MSFLHPFLLLMRRSLLPVWACHCWATLPAGWRLRRRDKIPMIGWLSPSNPASRIPASPYLSFVLLLARYAYISFTSNPLIIFFFFCTIAYPLILRHTATSRSDHGYSCIGGIDDAVAVARLLDLPNMPSPVSKDLSGLRIRKARTHSLIIPEPRSQVVEYAAADRAKGRRHHTDYQRTHITRLREM